MFQVVLQYFEYRFASFYIWGAIQQLQRAPRARKKSIPVIKGVNDEQNEVRNLLVQVATCSGQTVNQ